MSAGLHSSIHASAAAAASAHYGGRSVRKSRDGQDSSNVIWTFFPLLNDTIGGPPALFPLCSFRLNGLEVTGVRRARTVDITRRTDSRTKARKPRKAGRSQMTDGLSQPSDRYNPTLMVDQWQQLNYPRRKVASGCAQSHQVM